MSNSDRTRLFDTWAAAYDRAVITDGDFPFAGYEPVLDEIVRRAQVQADALVLDIGTGTGNLAARFATLGCRVWGIDFSAAMLAHAQAKLPQATFIQANLLDEWPQTLDRRFDCIVAAYVLHEFELPAKLALLERLAQRYLIPNGRIIVGDIAFMTAHDREQACQQWQDSWDDDEYYWAADEAVAALEQAGLKTEYVQVSWCAGIFSITSPTHP